MEEGDARALRRTRAVGGDASRRAARARADGVPFRRVLGSPRDVRSRARSRRDSSRVDGARVAQGKDFEPTTGELRESGVVQLDEARARTLAESLADSTFAVRSVDERPYRRKPAAPFRTATLQQEASRKLRFSAQTTMRVAQRLYESGLHHVHADRLDDALRVRARRRPRAGRRALRRGLRPGEAAAVRPSGRERPGGARGDQAGRRRPSGRRRSSRASSTATSSRSTTSSGSGRSPRRWRTRAARRCRCGSARRARTARTSSSAPRARSSPSAASSPPTSPARTSRPTTTRSASSRSCRRPGGHARLARARRARDGSAGPLHGADARTRPRRARHRAAVDLRGDPLHDRRPRLRVQEGDGARAHLRRVLGREPARAPLRAARRLRLHRADGGRPRPHRSGRAGARSSGSSASTSATGATPGCTTS